MTEIGHGSVIRYSYLWAREHDRGEDAGRKARPACIMLIIRGKGGLETTLFFPITSRSPGPDTLAIEIPEIEARRARLYSPSWVIVDEFNTDDIATSFAIEDRQPLGIFSRTFMARIAAAAAAAIRAGQSRNVQRD